MAVYFHDKRQHISVFHSYAMKTNCIKFHEKGEWANDWVYYRLEQSNKVDECALFVAKINAKEE